MSKPLPTSHPMFRMVEKQLMDAMRADDLFTCGGACGNQPLALGLQSSAVLAEILGAARRSTAPPTVDTPAELQAEIERLTAIINTPENDVFLRGVSIEAEYQRQKHGTLSEGSFVNHQNYYWVAGYLLGKALWSLTHRNRDKGKHHLVTAAALLFNWHNALTGKPAAAADNPAGKQFADSL